MLGMTASLAAIPALFTVAIGLLITHGLEPPRAGQRLLLFLAAAGGLITAAIFVNFQLAQAAGDSPVSLLAYLLLPTLIGLWALTVLHLGYSAGLPRPAQAGVALALVAQAALVYLQGSQFDLYFLVFPSVFVLVVAWGVGMRSRKLALLLSVLALAGLIFFYRSILNRPLGEQDLALLGGLGMLQVLVSFGLPALLMVLPAVLITQALRSPAHAAGKTTAQRSWLRFLLLGLALILPVFPLLVIYWSAIWDQTNDGIGGIAFAQLFGIVTIGAGMAMLLALPGKYRWAGLAFLLVAPWLPLQAMALGLQTSHHTITEERAAHIAQALGQYRGREGRYPAMLSELAPRDLLFIAQPVLLPGETWCYQAGADAYRLEAFYREFFSAPVSLRLYQSVGDMPPEASECAGRLAAMQERFPSPIDNPAFYQPPPPTPLPPSVLDFPKTTVQPLLEGARAVPGSWSTDSSYFFFGAQNDKATQTLYFLAGDSGALCAAPGEFTAVESMDRQHAWLPDGRVFYVDPGGKVVLLAPCSDEVVDLTPSLDEPVRTIAARSPESGRLLLQGEEHYWIIDGPAHGQAPALRQVKGVTPNPYDLHWDNFDFLPGGDEVAISHLNGRDASTGSTLYLVAADSGEVQNSLALEMASHQSAPWIEALVGKQVIVSGENALLLVDLGSSPPRVTDVVADMFHLDAEYPSEFASAGWVADGDGQGYYMVMRLNHALDKALYWLHGPDGKVEVLDNDLPTLVLTPDNQLWDMSPWEDKPSYKAQYALAALESGATSVLHFDGHTPRGDAGLHFAYLPATQRIAAASEQGVALHRATDGEMEVFWVLESGGYGPSLLAAPDGTASVASKSFGPLYWLPLPATNDAGT